MIILLWLVLGPVVGYAIGKTRNCEGMGLVGPVMGPVGWLLTLLNDRRERCPDFTKAPSLLEPPNALCGSAFNPSRL